MKKIRIFDRKKAIEKAEELERRQQRRLSAFSMLLSDICRFKLCILATYPSEPGNYEIPETRFESFSNIRTDLHQDLKTLRELDVEVPDKVSDVIDKASLYDFMTSEACEAYFEELEAACRTIIMYY
ncbi:hypothetical protein IJI89_03390 [Candidatus Saccharibacteria bacterium]|jgi:hypothetical protein|nr:hypothetical protein [Candidatus Saccharibacteria bacterium]